MIIKYNSNLDKYMICFILSINDIVFKEIYLAAITIEAKFILRMPEFHFY
jgi:hypothetical protein